MAGAKPVWLGPPENDFMLRRDPKGVTGSAPQSSWETGEVGESVDVETPLDEIYLDWACSIKRHRLVDVMLPLLDLLRAGRGVALPLVWMLAPFFGPHTLDPLEKALDNPTVLPALREYLLESEVSAS